MKHARPDYDRIQDPANKIPETEPVFLIRGQDKTAADVVRYWAFLNREGDPKAVRLALDHVARIEAWPVKKTADV